MKPEYEGVAFCVHCDWFVRYEIDSDEQAAAARNLAEHAFTCVANPLVVERDKLKGLVEDLQTACGVYSHAIAAWQVMCDDLKSTIRTVTEELQAAKDREVADGFRLQALKDSIDGCTQRVVAKADYAYRMDALAEERAIEIVALKAKVQELTEYNTSSYEAMNNFRELAEANEARLEESNNTLGQLGLELDHAIERAEGFERRLDAEHQMVHGQADRLIDLEANAIQLEAELETRIDLQITRELQMLKELERGKARAQELKHENITLADQIGPLVAKVQELKAHQHNTDCAACGWEVQGWKDKAQELEREVARLKEPLDWTLANLSSYIRNDARVQSGAFVEKFRAALALVSDANADNLLRPIPDVPKQNRPLT